MTTTEKSIHREDENRMISITVTLVSIIILSQFGSRVKTFFQKATKPRKLEGIIPGTSKCAFCVLSATILKEVGVF